MTHYAFNHFVDANGGAVYKSTVKSKRSSVRNTFLYIRAVPTLMLVATATHADEPGCLDIKLASALTGVEKPMIPNIRIEQRLAGLEKAIRVCLDLKKYQPIKIMKPSGDICSNRRLSLGNLLDCKHSVNVVATSEQTRSSSSTSLVHKRPAGKCFLKASKRRR
jgi:hypothetical protein